MCSDPAGPDLDQNGQTSLCKKKVLHFMLWHDYQNVCVVSLKEMCNISNHDVHEVQTYQNISKHLCICERSSNEDNKIVYVRNMFLEEDRS